MKITYNIPCGDQMRKFEIEEGDHVGTMKMSLEQLKGYKKQKIRLCLPLDYVNSDIEAVEMILNSKDPRKNSMNYLRVSEKNTLKQFLPKGKMAVVHYLKSKGEWV